MNTNKLLLPALFIGAVLSVNQSRAQSKLIHFWDFNQTVPFAGTGHDSLGTVFSYANSLTTDSTTGTWPLYPNYTTLPASNAKIEYYRPSKLYTSIRDSILDNGTPGSFYYDFSSTNYNYYTTSDSGNVGGNMFIRARNPSDSCMMYLYLPTNKYNHIHLDFAISASSSKGANYALFSYSTNGGTSWNKLTKAMDTFNISGVYRPDTLLMNNQITSVSAWYPVQMDFSSDSKVNNNPNFIVRFMLAGVSTVNTSGNSRFDNFALTGDTDLFTSVTNAIKNGGYSVYPNPGKDNVTINSSAYSGKKLITLYNVVGQTVNSFENSGKQTTIDLSQISSGIYFVEIKEEATGNKYTVKVVKE